MALTRTIDVQDFMNSHKLSAYQVRIIALCFLIVAIDGFDTAAIGFIAPALRAEWGVTAAQLAPLFGAGLFGLMVGAFIFGPLADKIGRKYSLVLTVLFFGGASLASAWSTFAAGAFGSTEPVVSGTLRFGQSSSFRALASFWSPQPWQIDTTQDCQRPLVFSSADLACSR